MTVILDQQWQDISCQIIMNSTNHGMPFGKKPTLRVSPDYARSTSVPSPVSSPSKTAQPGMLSPAGLSSPVSPSSPSSSFRQRMHSRVRSLSGSKAPLSAAQRWERLLDADKERSERFVKDLVAMCGLAGFSWKKTYDYMQLAKELPLNPQYVPDAYLVPITPSESSSSSSFSRFLSPKPSNNSLLTPDSASARSGSSRPTTPLSTAASSVASDPDLKPILTRIRQLFECMQSGRDPAYLHYVNLPGNNLKKMHATATAAHRAATLKRERSSLMDAIEFDRRAEKSREMETAVAKLRFEMELDAPQAISERQGVSDLSRTSSQNLSGTTQNSLTATISATSSQMTIQSLEMSNMRQEASRNNRVSGVPTVITTTSEPTHMRHLSIASSIDRPDSPASAKSEGHVQSRDTWTRLQEARSRMSRRSKSRVDGIARPGTAQKLDSMGFFAQRPTDA